MFRAFSFRHVVFAAALLVVASVGPMSASAEEPVELKGVVRISMNVAYASVTVNGAEFGGVTFENNGKVCVVSNLAENMFPVTIELKPSEDGYANAEVTAEWKKLKKVRKRVKGGWNVYKLLKTKVTFAKGKNAPKPSKPAPGKKPATKPKPDESDDL